MDYFNEKEGDYNDYNDRYYWKNLLVIDRCRFVEIWNLDCIEYYSIKK